MTANELIDDFVEYFGEYRKDMHREVVYNYITRRYATNQYKLLKKFVYEYHPLNYGPPIVSNLKTVEYRATQEGVSFYRPRKKLDVLLTKCQKCGKKMRYAETDCPYCHEIQRGTRTVILPKGYFD